MWHHLDQRANVPAPGYLLLAKREARNIVLARFSKCASKGTEGILVGGHYQYRSNLEQHVEHKFLCL